MYKLTPGHRGDESCLELYTRTLQPQSHGWQCCVPTPESCLSLAVSAAYFLITYTVVARLVPFPRKIMPFVTHHNPCPLEPSSTRRSLVGSGRRRHCVSYWIMSY